MWTELEVWPRVELAGMGLAMLRADAVRLGLGTGWVTQHVDDRRWMEDELAGMNLEKQNGTAAEHAGLGLQERKVLD